MNTSDNFEPKESNSEETPSTANKNKNDAIVKRGVRWLIAGIVILLGSFAITFILYQADLSITTVMYTLNIAGGICIFKGMMDILGF
ncbi:MAG: hypothetical protein ACOYOA_00950 [Saprospiraceae bacterium]